MPSVDAFLSLGEFQNYLILHINRKIAEIPKEIVTIIINYL